VWVDYLPTEQLQNKLPFPGGVTDLANRITIGLYESMSVFISGLNGLSEMAAALAPVRMLEALLGTLLWGLFIISFSRKVIR
jgi:hypothetical protein